MFDEGVEIKEFNRFLRPGQRIGRLPVWPALHQEKQIEGRWAEEGRLQGKPSSTHKHHRYQIRKGSKDWTPGYRYPNHRHTNPLIVKKLNERKNIQPHTLLGNNIGGEMVKGMKPRPEDGARGSRNGVMRALHLRLDRRKELSGFLQVGKEEED